MWTPVRPPTIAAFRAMVLGWTGTAIDELVLVVTMQDGKERSGFAFRGQIVAGRDDGCDLKLAHPKVSRRHVEFSMRKDGSIVIRDLKSTNGTIVDGKTLSDGDVVVHGPVTIEVGPYSIHASAAIEDRDVTVIGNLGPNVTRIG